MKPLTLTFRLALAFATLTAAVAPAQTPRATGDGYLLPNGWRLSPVGRHVTLADYVLNLTPSPDGRSLVALHCGHGPHGLAVIDPATLEIRQQVPLRSAWLGLAWAPDGRTLYVSGGNATSRTAPAVAPVYAFEFHDGRLSAQPVRELKHRLPADALYWSDLAHHPTKLLLYDG